MRADEKVSSSCSTSQSWLVVQGQFHPCAFFIFSVKSCSIMWKHQSNYHKLSAQPIAWLNHRKYTTGHTLNTNMSQWYCPCCWLWDLIQNDWIKSLLVVMVYLSCSVLQRDFTGFLPPVCCVVPVLYHGLYCTIFIKHMFDNFESSQQSLTGTLFQHQALRGKVNIELELTQKCSACKIWHHCHSFLICVFSAEKYNAAYQPADQPWHQRVSPVPVCLSVCPHSTTHSVNI